MYMCRKIRLLKFQGSVSPFSYRYISSLRLNRNDDQRLTIFTVCFASDFLTPERLFAISARTY